MLKPLDCMIATNNLSNFHHWLLSMPVASASARAIVLHGGSPGFRERLIEELTEYLNEYDDDGAGRWLAATSDLVMQVSESPELRCLLGIEDGCQNCPPKSPCGIRKTLSALGKRGHVIVPSTKDVEVPEAFHAGIDSNSDTAGHCHILLNPELMNPTCFAPIIGDVFLEWLHCQLLRAPRENKVP
jgi:hypothetical protein